MKKVKIPTPAEFEARMRAMYVARAQRMDLVQPEYFQLIPIEAKHFVESFGVPAKPTTK